MSSHVVVMGKYYVTPDKLNRNEVAFTVTLLIRIQSWHNEENDLLHFSNIQRTETKQICFFVATVSSTTITVWAWPSPPPSWGSGPAATKERAVAYTRRPSCCEPRLYSASRKGIGLWWHHQSFFTGQGQGQRSSSTFFDISRPKSGFEAIKYIFDMVSSEPHSLSTSTTCYIHTLDVRLWHNGVSSICQF